VATVEKPPSCNRISRCRPGSTPPSAFCCAFSCAGTLLGARGAVGSRRCRARRDCSPSVDARASPQFAARAVLRGGFRLGAILGVSGKRTLGAWVYRSRSPANACVHRARVSNPTSALKNAHTAGVLPTNARRNSIAAAMLIASSSGGIAGSGGCNS